MPPSDPKAAGDQPQAGRVKRLGNLLIVLSTLGVVVLGIVATRDVWHRTPVAAAFTRVGGATRVETALEASRFWRTPPRCVVMTDASAKQETLMFAAAWYAMIHDAPLLFTSQDPKREQLVDATITAWQTDATARHQKPPDVITFKSPDDVIGHCQVKADPADVDGLSTLSVPNQPLQVPHVAPQNTLAPVVVFAAAIEPADPPDVAVGMALAAHMASADREVSLVVVPHYLESDPELVNTLQNQHELVNGGVVLGQTPTVPEDTRVLLRQLLTSRDQLGLIAQVQGDLANVEPFITALLALLAASVLVREAPEIKEQAGPQVAKAWHQVARARPLVASVRHQVAEAVRLPGKLLRKVQEMMPNGKNGSDQPIPTIADLRIALRDQQQVTVWLRNGWTLTGTTGEQGSSTGQGKDPTVTVLRLENVTLEKAAAQIGTANSVLVPIGEIDLIATGFSNPAPRGTTTVSATAHAGAPDQTAQA